MNDGIVKLDPQHQTLWNWATKQLSTIITFMNEPEIDSWLNRHIMLERTDLEKALFELLDMAQSSAKKGEEYTVIP